MGLLPGRGMRCSPAGGFSTSLGGLLGAESDTADAADDAADDAKADHDDDDDEDEDASGEAIGSIVEGIGGSLVEVAALTVVTVFVVALVGRDALLTIAPQGFNAVVAHFEIFKFCLLL